MKLAMMERRERQETVMLLGFRNYKSYLGSGLWEGIKERVVAAKGSKCCCCKSKDHDHIHHEFYDLGTMEGESLRYLWPICESCHDKVHRNNRGKFMSCFESSKKLDSMRRNQERKRNKKHRRLKKRKRERDFVNSMINLCPACSGSLNSIGCCPECPALPKPEIWNHLMELPDEMVHEVSELDAMFMNATS